MARSIEERVAALEAHIAAAEAVRAEQAARQTWAQEEMAKARRKPVDPQER